VRKSEGKDSYVYIHGSLVPPQNVLKETTRHGSLVNQYLLQAGEFALPNRDSRRPEVQTEPHPALLAHVRIFTSDHCVSFSDVILLSGSSSYESRCSLLQVP